VAENLRDVSARIRDGEGALGKLLTTEEAYKKLDASLDDLNAVTSALREGEGTLGKLMRDEKLYEQISQIADDLQAMLDTYREQSPVLTFAGAVFGAF
jgi:phospholipid/cholesterol/gamma-HCH transport system substrate-binding protein